MFFFFRSNLDDTTSDEDTDEFNLSEYVSNEFKNTISDSTCYRFPEPYKNTEQ